MSEPVRATASVDWSEGTWTTPPHAVEERDGMLIVTAEEGSDAWRLTSYGFVHDTEHALVAPLPDGSAMEVDFDIPFEAQFDQAGLFVRVDDTRWVKTGIEYTDGELNLGAVVTDGMSDWSLAPVSHWRGRRITVRVSRDGTALTVRAGAAGEPLHLVRVIPFADDLDAAAGPFVCAPSRAGLTVSFTGWRRGDADADLH
jgi:regulation of enolase protein 1 (concanavalin A-like superfamily)